MDWKEAGRYWDENARAWTTMARLGYDICRNYLNTPAFLEMLPNVAGLNGLDIGCGEGYNTRLVAERGARMTALELSPTFLHYARHMEATEEPKGIRFVRGSAVELPFTASSFDFIMATMSLMEFEELDEAIREAFRVLKPGGFLQFSITHPCFQTPQFTWIKDEAGNRTGIVCGDYFQSPTRVEEWTFGNAPPELKAEFGKFRVPTICRTLSDWLNTLIRAGFVIEEVLEPYPDEAIRLHPGLQDERIIALFLHIRCRKHG